MELFTYLRNHYSKVRLILFDAKYDQMNPMITKKIKNKYKPPNPSILLCLDKHINL